MSMTVMQLIEYLEALVEDDEGLADAEVRVATQPNYPLQSHLRGVATLHKAIIENNGQEPCDHGYYNCDACEEEAIDGHDDIVYLVEGSQVYDDPYAMRELWDVAEGDF